MNKMIDHRTMISDSYAPYGEIQALPDPPEPQRREPKLLRRAQKRCVKLRIDFDIAAQAQHVLFDVRKLLDLGIDAGHFTLQLLYLLIDRLHAGMPCLEAREKLLFLLPQIHDLGLRLQGLLQNCFCLFSKIDRATAVSKLVVSRFRPLQFLLQFRQLRIKESERLFRLFRFCIHVLPYVFSTDLIQDAGSGFRIRAF